MHGLRADLRDAFADTAPMIELVNDAAEIDADVVVMLAGMTIPTDPRQPLDRAQLAHRNHSLFVEYAEAVAARAIPPLVIVQSNPVEVGVKAFADALGRRRVIGAGACSDSLRFRREIADSLGVPRSSVRARVLGQHGDQFVPQWSSIEVDGLDRAVVDEWITAQRAGRSLADLPAEIVELRAEMMALVVDNEVHEAFSRIARRPADLRAAVKPFLVHCTTGHTTEIITAHAVEELLVAIAVGDPIECMGQVELDGELGLHGVGGFPVMLGRDGWTDVIDPGLADEEIAALRRSLGVVDELLASLER